jgi:hypothetical protein
MILREAIAIGLAALGAVVLSACQSTQDTSAQLAREGRKAFSEKGIVVLQRARDIRVVETAAFQDRNGAAAVVVLRNESPEAIAGVPISIDVVGPGGGSVFKNDAPGLEPSLTHAASLPARGELDWVNDQVTPSGQVQSVKPTVGAPGSRTAKPLPKLDVSSPALTVDPVSGVEATGTATNRSSVEQLKLIVYCVARRGSRIVAAGRAQIARLRPGQKRPYHVFFIGDPRGARVTVEAPPSVVQ